MQALAWSVQGAHGAIRWGPRRRTPAKVACQADGVVPEVLSTTRSALLARPALGRENLVRPARRFARHAQLASGALRWEPHLQSIALTAHQVLGAMRAAPRHRKVAGHADQALGAQLGVQITRARARSARLAPTSPLSGRQARACASDAPLESTTWSQARRPAPNARLVRGTMNSRRQHALCVRKASGHHRPAHCGRAIVSLVQVLAVACQTAARGSPWS
mmetsp:Transcript_63777/g.160794  ORF Transcript_63777/g.160794 Transcript_63777/m.160794 type:complete len:220 (+) Transcript_63777:271-930(+)